jgi:hypothetical protein
MQESLEYRESSPCTQSLGGPDNIHGLSGLEYSHGLGGPE